MTAQIGQIELRNRVNKYVVTKKFSDFDIKPTLPNFIGEKKLMYQVLNCEIVIHDFAIEDSKFGSEKKRLKLQISISDIKFVMFTGSIGVLLQDQWLSHLLKFR